MLPVSAKLAKSLKRAGDSHFTASEELIQDEL
jgi:hypothetical protein